MNTAGLANTIACETYISAIEEDRLSYFGYDIDEFMHQDATFEEVIFLLWNGHLPTTTEYALFTRALREQYAIGEAVESCLRIQCRQNLHPMSVLRSTVSLLGVFDKEAEATDAEAVYRQSISLQAKLPTIIASFCRLRQGLDPIVPDENLGLAENFLYMLTGEIPRVIDVQALDRALILHADHELNASTFAARVCASTLSDTYSCVTAAIGTLKGALHGGANERVFDMLEEIAVEQNATQYILEKLGSNEKIMGFGHRVYTTVDPRQIYLKEMAQQMTDQTENQIWYHLSEEVEKVIRQEKGLIPNVDFYSATVYHVLGIDKDLFTLIFAMSRVAGWLAHIAEQKQANRLIRPRSQYKGQLNQRYERMTERVGQLYA